MDESQLLVNKGSIKPSIEKKTCKKKKGNKNILEEQPEPSLTIYIHKYRGRKSTICKRKYKDACDILAIVLNSEDFYKRLTSKKFQLSETNGYSNQEIYHKIVFGKDRFNKKKCSGIHVDITLYWTKKNVIGRTFTNTYKTWVNKRYLIRKNKTREFYVGHILHEFLHTLGFSHKNKETRKTSVPYKVGRLARQIAKKKCKSQPLKTNQTTEKVNH